MLAVVRSVYLELSAKLQMQAMLIAGPGGHVVYLDEREVAANQWPSGFPPARGNAPGTFGASRRGRKSKWSRRQSGGAGNEYRAHN